MTSSKVPHVYVPVSDALISLAAEMSETCFINRRQTQRPLPSSDAEKLFRNAMFYCDGDDIDYDVARFLASIKDTRRIVIHYQGYGDDEQRTVVADAPRVACWSQGTPRLDFEKPSNWKHCPNFWGAFILGIATVENVDVTQALDDPEGTQFMDIVRTHGIRTTLPETLKSEDCR